MFVRFKLALRAFSPLTNPPPWEQGGMRKSVAPAASITSIDLMKRCALSALRNLSPLSSVATAREVWSYARRADAKLKRARHACWKTALIDLASKSLARSALSLAQKLIN